MTGAVRIYVHHGRRRERYNFPSRTGEGRRMLVMMRSLGYRVIAYGTEEGALTVHLSA